MVNPLWHLPDACTPGFNGFGGRAYHFPLTKFMGAKVWMSHLLLHGPSFPSSAIKAAWITDELCSIGRDVAFLLPFCINGVSIEDSRNGICTWPGLLVVFDLKVLNDHFIGLF